MSNDDSILQEEVIVHSLRFEYIELNKLLKIEGLVSSGAEAKLSSDDGMVIVNGQVETRRRKNLYAGDIVEFLESRIQVVEQ